MIECYAEGYDWEKFTRRFEEWEGLDDRDFMHQSTKDLRLMRGWIEEIKAKPRDSWTIYDQKRYREYSREIAQIVSQLRRFSFDADPDVATQILVDFADSHYQRSDHWEAKGEQRDARLSRQIADELFALMNDNQKAEFHQYVVTRTPFKF